MSYGAFPQAAHGGYQQPPYGGAGAYPQGSYPQAPQQYPQSYQQQPFQQPFQQPMGFQQPVPQYQGPHGRPGEYPSAPNYNQPGGYPGQQGGLSAVQQWSGTGAGGGFGAPQVPPQALTWSDPIDLEIPSCDGDQFEMKKLIAREYNNSPAAAGDHISSQNIEILAMQPRGSNARVSFRVNDGEYPPDPQERGLLKWIIVGGIAAFAVHKISQSRKRKGRYGRC